ncbi:MAG: anti-sigma factor antagonist [Firmicutes bacterium HGW-Firmicutes-7]|nr:MAG: anti-sigma factor antagonist [Firmicutes bacterium HGW-Firmicutes-7]
MEIMKNIEGSTAQLALVGRLDSITSTQLSKELDNLFENGPISIVFDFNALEYISSAGLRILLTAQKKINSMGTKLKITGARPLVKEVFDVTGFSGIIEIE